MKINLFNLKTAEVLSFVISTGIILGLFIYLGIEHMQSTNSSSLKMKTTVLTESISQEGNIYILPIRVENLSDRTPSKAIFQIKTGDADQVQKDEFEIEYLSRHSSKIIYWSLDQDPRNKNIEIQLKNYQF